MSVTCPTIVFIVEFWAESGVKAGTENSSESLTHVRTNALSKILKRLKHCSTLARLLLNLF